MSVREESDWDHLIRGDSNALRDLKIWWEVRSKELGNGDCVWTPQDEKVCGKTNEASAHSEEEEEGEGWMSFDPDFGHYRGADGKARGFEPAQGAAGANPILEGLKWWFPLAGGEYADSVTGKTLTAVNSPTSETGPAGVSGTSMGVAAGDSNYVYSTDSYFRTVAESTGSGPETYYPFTCTFWVYMASGAHTWIMGDTNQWQCYKYPSGGHQMHCGVKANGSYWRLANTSGSGLSDSTWYFFAFRYYGHGYESDGSVGSWVNGKRVNRVSGSAGSGSIAETGTQDCCGESLQTGAGITFGGAGTATGRLAMVGYWDRVITDAEVLEIYNTTLGGGGYPF